jgi:uncharacterized phage protein gp47/JayE
MPYDDDGYTKKTETEIMLEKEELYRDLFEIINNSISDVTWQWIKLQLYERMEIEALHETASEMMSISEAQGAFLDKWGIECGIERKGATKAQGYVEVTYNIQGVPFIVPAGTQFQSSTNIYTSDDESEIPYIITMTKTKTGESDDYFSSDIESVNSLVQILDENLNVISPSYYTLDSVYKNNIQWTENSDEVIIENESYFVYVNGNVIRRIEVTSVAEGVESNASIDTVTVCIDFPSLVCTNREEIVGGAEEEEDDDYRERLLVARRRTFTLGSIKDIILGLAGVRSVKVYQNVGTDQTSVADWDNPTRGTDVPLSGYQVPMYSQAFVPGDQIATLGKITLYGRPVNDPPAIYCGIKTDIDTFVTGEYKDYISVEKYELDPALTGDKDISFNVKYNNMDKTRTYRFDVWCADPENPSFDWNTHHWLLATSTEGYRNDSRGMFYYHSGTGTTWIPQGNGIDLMFKTHFNGAGFTCVVATEDGYGFDGDGNIKDQIETYLDYVEGGGYSPICIQPYIIEADEILIDVKGVIYITSLADFQDVRREIISSIETYLENLDVGDNVVYSRIFQVIMDHEQVWKLEDLYIKREDVGDWGVIDLGILDDEIPDLGARSFQRG